MRSRSGPEIRLRYFSTCGGVQIQARRGSVAARTWLHLGHQNKLGRKCRAAESPADRDAPFLEWLAQDLERLAVKLWHLIEE
jgi:hypothetical protein